MPRNTGGGGHSSGGSRSHASSGSSGSSRSHSHSGGRSTSFSHDIDISDIFNTISHSSRHYTRYPPNAMSSHPITRLNTIITIILIIIAVITACALSSNKNIAPASTTQRTKLTDNYAYVDNCIIDEIGWINNETQLARDLMPFYEQTGCQPFIYLKKYDPKLAGEDHETDREAWTQNYYDTTFADRQNTVLYVYFCDKNDEGIGEDTLWKGSAASTIMDPEAMEIFWAYLYHNWDTWDRKDNDGMFAATFNNTAERIMTVTTTTKDIAKVGIIAITIAIAVIGVIIITYMIHKREREKAQETIDILNAPLETSNDSEIDNLADRYTDSEEQNRHE